MPTSPAKRAWIAVAAAACLLLVAGAIAYFHRTDQSLSIFVGAPPAPAPGHGAESAPDILSQLPGDAPAIAYIDVAALRNLRDSPLASILGLAGTDPANDRDYQQFVDDTGFDYTRDLDKAAIAFWPASVSAAPGTPSDARAVVIAEGRFDQAKIKARALRYGKLVKRGEETVYEAPGNPPVSLEFLSPTRIALGSGPGAEKLLGTRPGKREPAMQARIDRVTAAPIFAVARADHLPPGFYDTFRSSPQLVSFAKDITGLTLAGQPSGDQIRMTLDAECNSATNALEIATLLDGLRMFGSVALDDPKTRRQMTKEQAALLMALASHAKLSHQGHWVRLSLDITPAMLGEPKAQASAKP